MSDLDLMFASLRAPNRNSEIRRMSRDPDRDNLALIMGMAAYTRDALTGAPLEDVERRRANLQRCISSSLEDGTLSPVAKPIIDDLMAAVDAVTAERRFAAAASAFTQDPTELPTRPTPDQLTAALQAGAPSRNAATRIWQAMAGALSSTAR